MSLIIGIAGTEVWACGDSLYRVGKGISYRVYTAPLPGSVLVYGPSESAKQLADALSESGHSVDVVENEIDLSLKMQSGQYDVVIASYSEHDTIEASSVTGASTTSYLPVALNRQEAEIAGQSYDEVMLADRDEIKDYLKAIHKTLKSKAS
ncbi:MAG TPA: hypothetical protein VFG52_02980 [Xanthomonadales bacterium]|nr:hypothetical protein [Xanthomonadales bacterium]